MSEDEQRPNIIDQHAAEQGESASEQEAQPQGKDALRRAILSAQDVQLAPLWIPEWNVTVYIAGLTGYERDQFENREAQLTVEQRKEQFRARLAQEVVRDSDGQHIFSLDDLHELESKSSRALERIFWKSEELNAMYTDALEGLEKNLGRDLSGSNGLS